jgi:hypothetical protein
MFYPGRVSRAWPESCCQLRVSGRGNKQCAAFASDRAGRVVVDKSYYGASWAKAHSE